MIALVVLASGVTGCAALPSSGKASPAPNHFGDAPIRIERGQPNQVIDGLGWIAGIPNKVALWDRRADNHDISPATEEQLARYMRENSLEDVLVRINQYDPVGEWKRLSENKRVGAGWRYTVGTLNMLEYTLLPGRILGGDWYNPFTDTVNLYSDIPALALAEAAYAKDVRRQRYPGAYSALKEVPIAGMWHETVATEDVLDYVQARGTTAEQAEAYRILYPDYGASWGGQFASFIPYGHLFGRLAGAAVGHTANGARQLVAPDEEPMSDEVFVETARIERAGDNQQDARSRMARLPSTDRDVGPADNSSTLVRY